MELDTIPESKDIEDEKRPIQTDDGSEESKKACFCFQNNTMCIVQTGLIKFKIFFFFFGASIGSVFPFFSLYYKQIGFSPNQIGIISGMRPLIGFCSGPVWGSIADRFRIRKLILSCSAFGWLIFISSVGFIPPPQYSNDQCVFVKEFLDSSINMSELEATDTNPESSIERAKFLRLHDLVGDTSPMDSLMESRGWMYDEHSLLETFGIIMALIVLGEVLQSPFGAIADTGCIEHLGNENMHRYGHQRAWGSLGLGLFSLLTGGVVSMTRRDTKACGVLVTISNYRIAFFIFAGCMTCCLVTTFFFKFKDMDNNQTTKERPNPLKVFQMFLTWHYGSWLFCMIFTGVCNGVILGFLNWHLENIGATQLVIGLANCTSLFSEMLMFLIVFRILDRTGCLLFMTLGLLGYCVRFSAFASIENPWWVLPFEVLQGFTFAGTWSVNVKYLCSEVPSEYLGTLQGFIHGVFWGLGSGTGHMVGGILVEMLGARLTFWIFSVVSFLNMVIFVVIQKITSRPDIFNYEELPEKK